MRISIVAPRLERGGLEMFMLRIGRGFQLQGHQVEILLTVEKGPWFGEAARWGLSTRCLPAADSYSKRAHIRRIAAELTESGCDVCLLNHDPLAQAGLGLLPDRVVVIPVIHNDAPMVYKVACANSDSWNVLVGVSDKIVQHASSVIGTRPIIGIPNGVDAPDTIPHRGLRPQGQPLRLLFAGRLNQEQKGVLFLPLILAECLRRGLQCTLTVAGDGPAKAELERDFRLAGMSSKVTMLGWLDSRRVATEMREADVLLLPSFHEGLPVVLLEAMANGCVPVASRLQGITDSVAVDGQSGFLVRVGDVGGFASAVENLARRPELLLGMSNAAVVRTKGNFTVECMSERYSRLIADAEAGHFPLPRSRSRQIDPQLLTWRDFIPNKFLACYRRNKALYKTAVKRTSP